jgi:hypothetical protein
VSAEPEITLAEMLEAIEDYPYLRECLSNHIKWLFEKGSGDRKNYDPVYMKIKNDKTATGLRYLEITLSEAGKVLGLNEVEFCRAFEFNNPDRLAILKIGDLLAEPWVALALKNIGFVSIKKVPKPKGDERFADFVGKFRNYRFAIEVKNVRTELNFHQWMVDTYADEESMSLLSDYYPDGRDMLQKERAFLDSALKQKFCTSQRKKFEEQLGNTAKRYGCQKRMLVLNLEATTLGFFPNQLVSQLENARRNYLYCDYWTRLILKIRSAFGYPVVDYLACCISQDLYCSPPLF